MDETVTDSETSVEGLLDVRQLRLLDLLYDVRSVTRAAEQLGQSQPTVSIWLARLRERLRDPLFVRTGGHMEPTPKTDALIGEVRSILASLRRLSVVTPHFDLATTRREFRICMTDASHITLMPPLLSAVRSQAPHVHLAAVRIDSTMQAQLQSGDADLALGFISELQNGFNQEILFAQDWICICAADHPRIQGSLSLEEYNKEGHIRIIYGPGQDMLETALRKYSMARRNVLELPGFLGLSTLVSTTDLLATLPREIGETVALMSSLQVLPCPFPIQRFTVKQYWHPRYDLEPGNRWLRGMCAALFKQEGIRSPVQKLGKAGAGQGTGRPLPA